MRTSDFDFNLPPDQIAQQPIARRDESRLMVVNRTSGAIEHKRFRDLVDLIPAGDVIALNRTR
ncbi:MAG TPA: S-adenosylmethionine:tRNA ribosyltransferase-isomerase, partial [Gemmatimonadaceae bacterium]|nr:S-adenosylmethionine:tRNA ribosyltransferase-isomerase [Gemmatimonadaceae bacterium]